MYNKYAVHMGHVGRELDFWPRFSRCCPWGVFLHKCFCRDRTLGGRWACRGTDRCTGHAPRDRPGRTVSPPSPARGSAPPGVRGNWGAAGNRAGSAHAYTDIYRTHLKYKITDVFSIHYAGGG